MSNYPGMTPDRVDELPVSDYVRIPMIHYLKKEVNESGSAPTTAEANGWTTVDIKNGSMT